MHLIALSYKLLVECGQKDEKDYESNKKYLNSYIWQKI